MNKTCIIGAGLTGLIQAWRAHQNGENISLIEASGNLGGVLQSAKINGYLLDYGANTLSVRNPKVSDILEELGLLEEAIDANPSANLRFIVREGKLISLPHNAFSFLTSAFLSPLGKLRLLIEPFMNKSNDLEETVADFISRRLGREALTYVGNPFLSGVYAAKPESLSLQNAFPTLQEWEQKHGSLLKGMLASRKNPDRLSGSRLISFSGGMKELPNRIAARLPIGSIKLHTPVLGIERMEDQWRVITENNCEKSEEFVFNRVICAVPAHRTEEIEWKGLHQKELISNLAEAKHYPLSLVYHGYEREKISHPLDGFGFLVPEVEQRKILGTLFSSTIFPGRAPKNKVLLTTFVGGERQPSLAKLKDSETHSLVEKEHHQLLGASAEPCFKKIVRWPKAIPLPNQSMKKRQFAAKTLEIKNPGLFFAGSHLCGPPLPNCITS